MYAQWPEIVRPPRPTNLTAFTRIHIVYPDRAEPSSQLLSSLLTLTQKTVMAHAQIPASAADVSSP